MKLVAEFDPATEQSDTFLVPQSAACGWMVVWNESNISLDLSFPDGSTGYAPAWYRRKFPTRVGSVKVVWAEHATLSSLAPPISEIIVESYSQNEYVPDDGPLVRQTNVGNPGGLPTNVTALSNTGNAPGSNWLNVKPSDATANTFTADNSGNLTVQSDDAGTLTTLLQLIAGASPAVKLAAASVLVEALGALQVDGALTVDGVSNVQDMHVNGHLYGHGGYIYIGDKLNADGGAITSDGSGNVVLTQLSASNGINYNIGRIKELNVFTGTGSGTFSHGLGGAPAFCVAICNIGGSSQTMGVGNYTATTVEVTAGAGLGWIGFAFR